MRTMSAVVFATLLVSMADLGLSAKAAANVIGTNIIAKPVTRERIAALPKNARREWVAYLGRSERQKAMDKQTLKDELEAASNTHPKHAGLGRGMFALRAEHPAE